MPYHHFKGSNLSRSETIQLIVLKEILDSKVPNEKRENSIEWELKHSSSCIQIARILAEKRSLGKEKVEIIAALHDISAIRSGSYEKHGQKGSEIAKNILKKTNEFSNDEIEEICEAIALHSEKQIYSNKPYAELIKDADVLDCSLYEGIIYDDKKPEIRKAYFERINKVRKELGLPIKADWND